MEKLEGVHEIVIVGFDRACGKDEAVRAWLRVHDGAIIFADFGSAALELSKYVDEINSNLTKFLLKENEDPILIKESPKSIFNKNNRKRHY